MDDKYFISLMEHIPRLLNATNVKMWQNYCIFRAGANVQVMPKMSNDALHREMAKCYSQHADMLISSELIVLLPHGMDKKYTVNY